MTFAWRDTQSTAPCYDRVLLLRYEDLVANPKQEAERICTFLGVDFNSSMIEAESFVDGADKPWTQNTSYSYGKRAFNQESVDKWRGVLTQKQVEFIEHLCFAEMIPFGYSLVEVNEFTIPPSMVFDPPELPKADLAEWIRPYAQLDPKILLREMALEHWRSTILTDSCPVSDDVKQALCLDIDFFDEARRMVKG